METGPLYEQAVQRMHAYRSVAARIGNARNSTAGKLDRRLEKLGELIGETLQQLTDTERIALSCWRDSIMQDTYEVDHEELMSKPYVSIRRVEHITEEYTVAERKAQLQEIKAQQNNPDTGRLKAFLSRFDQEL